MSKNKVISDAVIKRLPRYYRMLKILENEGTVRVSSGSLADMLNITASQVRQDFSNFGEFGQQGYGYTVSSLKAEIAGILGLDKPHDMIIIGCGNIGTALAHYKGFTDDGFTVRAAFDVNPQVAAGLPEEVAFYTMDRLSEYVESHNVDIAIIATQKEVALSVAEQLKSLGVNRIWNFAPTDISLSDSELVVENINMSDSLFVLSYKIK